MKKNRQGILALGALLCVMTVLFGVYTLTRPETAAGEKHITVTVVHRDGEEKLFAYDTQEEYLGPVLQEEGLVQGEMGQFGLYITAVDGETADYAVDGAYWALLEGEEYAMQGADQTVIEDGDQFSLVYTIG